MKVSELAVRLSRGTPCSPDDEVPAYVLQRLAQSYGVRSESVVAVSAVGSAMWGTATRASDLDLVIVHADASTVAIPDGPSPAAHDGGRHGASRKQPSSSTTAEASENDRRARAAAYVTSAVENVLEPSSAKKGKGKAKPSAKGGKAAPGSASASSVMTCSLATDIDAQVYALPELVRRAFRDFDAVAIAALFTPPHCALIDSVCPNAATTPPAPVAEEDGAVGDDAAAPAPTTSLPAVPCTFLSLLARAFVVHAVRYAFASAEFVSDERRAGHTALERPTNAASARILATAAGHSEKGRARVAKLIEHGDVRKAAKVMLQIVRSAFIAREIACAVDTAACDLFAERQSDGQTITMTSCAALVNTRDTTHRSVTAAVAKVYAAFTAPVLKQWYEATRDQFAELQVAVEAPLSGPCDDDETVEVVAATLNDDAEAVDATEDAAFELSVATFASTLDRCLAVVPLNKAKTTAGLYC